MTVVPLHDQYDDRLADYRGLRSPRDRERYEAAAGVLIAEGVTVIRRLLGSGLRVRSLLVTPERAAALAPLAGPVPVYVASREVLEAVTGFDVHRGALAAADRPAPLEAPALLRRARRVAVLEAVNDHENVGAVFRSAAALGMDGVLLDHRCADPLYRRAVRVSMGHVLTLPWARLSSLGDLAGAGYAVWALTPSPTAERLDDAAAALAPADRVAVLLGAEGPGLTAASLADADRRVRIPMAPDADSLNVAAAAAVAFARLGRAG